MSRPGRCRRPRSCRMPSGRRTSATGTTWKASSLGCTPRSRGSTPALFGVSVVGTGGAEYTAGDAEVDVRDHERRQALRLRARLRGARPRRGSRRGRRQRDRPALQLARGGRAERRRPDEPDGQPGRHRDHEPRRPARPPDARSGASSARALRSRAVRSRSTTRSTPPRRRPTTGTASLARPAPRATAGSTATRTRRPTSTRGRAR